MAKQYQVIVVRQVHKTLRTLPGRDLKRILDQIAELAYEPRPYGAIKMRGETSIYRLRQGNYRILYQVKDQIVTIIVFKVGHRRDVYEGR